MREKRLRFKHKHASGDRDTAPRRRTLPLRARRRHRHPRPLVSLDAFGSPKVSGIETVVYNQLTDVHIRPEAASTGAASVLGRRRRIHRSRRQRACGCRRGMAMRGSVRFIIAGGKGHQAFGRRPHAMQGIRRAPPRRAPGPAAGASDLGRPGPGRLISGTARLTGRTSFVQRPVGRRGLDRIRGPVLFCQPVRPSL